MRSNAMLLVGVLLVAATLVDAPSGAEVRRARFVTTTVVQAPVVSDLAAPSGHFEDSSIAVGQFQYQPTWSPWTFDVQSGISADDSAFTIENPDASDGTHVAFLQTTGAMSATHTFPTAGNWRIRFLAAQRKVSGIANRQMIRIRIGTTTVFEEEPVGTRYRLYTSRVLRTTGTSTSATVTFEGINPQGGDHTAFIDRIEVESVPDWNRGATWSTGAVPTALDDVVVPTGMAVCVRGTKTAQSIVVNGELLTAPEDTFLSAGHVAVNGETARFEVGRERVPFLQSFTLTLVGQDTGQNIMNAGEKFLMSMDGGTIDMHGIPRSVAVGATGQRTWVKLAAPMAAYATTVVVNQSVPWPVGSEIVIAGTNSYAVDPPIVDQTESRTITAVSPDGRTLTLAPSTKPSFAHFGASDATIQSIYTYSNGVRSWALDGRAEVGLLTHNVRVEGDVTSETTKFGAHVMMMKGPCCTSQIGGRGRFSNVEFFRVGQNKKLGRYPIHWHMQENLGLGQYARSCSIHRSYNRAVTIHGSENVVLEGNVAWDHVGHGYFLEDGSERFNQLLHNLALSTVRPPPGGGVLPSDSSPTVLQNQAPAAFWITNPRNDLVGNVAACTLGTGFWFIFPTAPMGLSGNANYTTYFLGLKPDHEPLGKFEDNTAHSASSGFDINDSIDAQHQVVANHPWSPPGTARQNFDRFTAWGTFTGLYFGASGPVYERIGFRDAVLADNFLNILPAAPVVIESSAVIAQTGNSDYSGGAVGYAAYDGPGRVFDSHFVGFSAGVNTWLGELGASMRHTLHRIRGLTFSPAGPPRILLPQYYATPINYGYFNDPQEPRRWGTVIRDEDGCITGTAGTNIVGNHPMMRSSTDWSFPEWISFLENAPQPPPLPIPGDGAYVSTHEFAHLSMRYIGIYGITPPVVPPPVTITRNLVGEAPVTFFNDFNTDDHKQCAVMVNRPGVAPDVYYSAAWSALPVNNEILITLDDLKELADGTHLVLRLECTTTPSFGDKTTLAVEHGDGSPVTPAATLVALRNSPTSAFYVPPASAPAPTPLYIRFVKPTGAMSEVIRVTW